MALAWRSAHLLLGRTHLLPLGTKELADFSERDIRVLRLDAVTVVLNEEHVGGKSTGALVLISRL